LNLNSNLNATIDDHLDRDAKGHRRGQRERSS
jgi:hypothetical protein